MDDPDLYLEYYSLGRGGDQPLSLDVISAQNVALSNNMARFLYGPLDGINMYPRRLPTSANYRYCIREIYPIGSDSLIPTEYIFTPATHHYYNTFDTATKPYMWWPVVAQLFNNTSAV